MIDLKMLELFVYEGILYFIVLVVIDVKKVVVVLKWLVKEMEDCYWKMLKIGVWNINGYNECMKEVMEMGEVIICMV